MQAFRRPVEQELLDRYAAFCFSRQLDSGVAFTEAMKFVAAATIASPKFLYLYEKSGSEETAAALDDFELASRLSFFSVGQSSGPGSAGSGSCGYSQHAGGS